MTGLLMKDVYLMRQSAKFMVFVMAIWSLLFLRGSKDGMFVIPMFTIWVSISMVNLFSYDKQTKWETYVLSMPVLRGKIVLERYLFTVCSALLAGVLAAAVVAAAQVFKSRPMGMDFFLELGSNLVFGVMIAFFYNAISFPLIFWLGVEKARLVPGVIMGAVILLFAIFALKYEGNIGVSDAAAIVYTIAGAAASVLAMAVSCLISISIYKKKEF